MTKPIPFEAIMNLDEQAIRESFPKGATEEKKRWRPARTKKEAHKTLARLLADKRKRTRRDVPRLLSSGSGYTSEPKYALGREKRHIGEFGEPEPEGVDAETQERFLKEAQEGDAKRAADRPLSERVAALEEVARRDQLRSIERRIGQVERAVDKKVA